MPVPPCARTHTACILMTLWVQYRLDAGAEALCPGFADMMLYLGGDVGESTFHILHSYHDLKNAHEVCLDCFL